MMYGGGAPDSRSGRGSTLMHRPLVRLQDCPPQPRRNGGGWTPLAIDDHIITLATGTLTWTDAAQPGCWRLRDGGPAWFLTLEG